MPTMKSLVFAAVISFALVFAEGISDLEEIHKKALQREEDAAKLCNSVYPVSEDILVHSKVARMVVKGDPVPKNFHTIEWCNLNCNLKKLGFFDAEGTMQVRKIYEFLIEELPEFKPNRQFLLIHLVQAYRMTKGLKDDCEKAFVAYYRFSEAIMTATLDADFHANTVAIEKVLNEELDGKSSSKELERAMEKALKNTELFFDLLILK